MNDSIEFVPGLIVKQRPANAPDYVIGNLSIKPRELEEWLASKKEEWVNVELKISKSGKAYAAVDSWKPQGAAPQQAPRQAKPVQRNDFDDAPF